MFAKYFKKIKRNKFKEIGSNVEISKTNRFISSANISVGNNVFIGDEGLYFGFGGITIGNGVIIAHRVEIMTRNHNYDGEGLKSIPYDNEYILKPVIIEDNVWIGSNVKIVPGVKIGEGAVVGMGSVVTKDIPEFAVVGGNPAKIIKYRNIDVYNELKQKDQIYLKNKNLIN